jgi:hypothetical protein
MKWIEVLKILAAMGTIGAGGLSILLPHSAEHFTGLSAVGPRGISEIRSVLGALFVGLGLAVVIFRVPAAYRTLGIGYLSVSLVRGLSIAFDRASVGSNWISLAFEVVFGVVLLI